MPKITDYEKSVELKPDNILLIDGGADGTKTITAENAARQLLELLLSQKVDGDTPAAATMHRNIYRGKNLGTTITEEQIEAIGNGTFKDLYVGDYWYMKLNETTFAKWRIMDMDYWYNGGEDSKSLFRKHHLVIMPDIPIKSSKMFESIPDSIPYDRSLVNDEFQYYDVLPAELQKVLIPHPEIVTVQTTNGNANSAAWDNYNLILPNEPMIFGCYIHSNPITLGSSYNIQGHKHSNSMHQLAGIRLCPMNAISIGTNSQRHSYWLRDVVDKTQFALVGQNGVSTFAQVTNAHGLRPVFAIGKPD